MKIFSLVLFLVSLKAFACPNFAGNYSCKNENETWNMSLTQTEENGATVYHQIVGDSEGTFIADGVARPHTVEAEGQVIEGTLSTTCLGESVQIQFLADYQGSPIDYVENMEMSSNILHVKDTTKMGGDEVNSTVYDCTPTN
jgi:hypothetical protein